ncbi:MAG: hypothetical protein ACR2KC_07855 [Acidimicrobiales bacterium]
MAIAVAAILVVVLTGGGSASKGPSAVNFKFNGTPVYGALGPEGVPLQLGPPLGAANAGLTGDPIDGISCNTSEQLVYHHHIHLVVFVNGQPASVPLGIGMVPPAIVQQSTRGDFAAGSQKCLYWLHVHAQDGIVHIESPEVKTFELGQLFDIWHQTLDPNHAGPATGPVSATLNGTPFAGDPRSIPLDERAQIVLNVGTPVVDPPPISWAGTKL